MHIGSTFTAGGNSFSKVSLSAVAFLIILKEKRNEYHLANNPGCVVNGSHDAALLHRKRAPSTTPARSITDGQPLCLT